MRHRQTTLKKLNRKYAIVSARRPPPAHISTTLIAKQMAENVTGTNGPDTIQKRVAIKDGVPLPRSLVRSTMKALDPGGPSRHFPSKRPPKARSTLTDSAVYYEVHLDGHEKLNFKALRMGHASIDTYGGRCHGSGCILQLVALPNARCGITIGHSYLDLVESTGEIPVQLTVDCGTETQYMREMHEQLRAQFLPDVSSADVPACVTLKSSDNIPIESLWSYFLKLTGHDLKAVILYGKTENYINIANDLHIDLFHWVWSKIVQNAIDHFVRYWNTHKTRNQRNKALPSGVSPQQVFENPQNFGLRHAGVPVDLNAVSTLRNMLPKSREECFRWVPVEFNLLATAAYQSLGSPELTISAGWTVFTRMLALLS
ncbi:hypothetical protein GGX14DRAFT_359351 [Mycena pura]|uniref:Integrase core domain-containing protein n=1 Tax=Mycena pura TaxID=153505 RepID=A0AAD6VL21_9AGAR|nr:hypothetical protein GGX14DRAFT_359351 [Mycena pura]